VRRLDHLQRRVADGHQQRCGSAHTASLLFGITPHTQHTAPTHISQLPAPNAGVTLTKRTITANGCPNHYSVCTGKDGPPGCSAVGAEGTDTEAAEQDHVIDIPAYPVIATSTTANECELGISSIALNGVSIFNGAVNQQCELVVTSDATSEWTSFDMCAGHAAMGNYHYHFPPSCLLAQAEATNPTADGHSPQIGWSFDGFPMYGPKGPGGVMRTAAELDSCGGKEEEIPDLDGFKYRYYFTGDVSNLYALPGYPMPDGATDYPFAQACVVGCTMAELTAGTCSVDTSRPGTTDSYVAAALAGYTTQFEAYATSGTNSPLLGGEGGMTTFLGCPVTPAEAPPPSPPSPPDPPLPPYTTPSPAPPPSPSSSDASGAEEEGGGKGKGGMVAGIVVGCLALVVIGGVVVYRKGRGAPGAPGGGTSTKDAEAMGQA